MTRNNDNDAIFKAGAVDRGKIDLTKISWFMPHVTPADKDKMKLYTIIERKEKLPVGYKMIQCDSAAIPETQLHLVGGFPLSHQLRYHVLL